MGDTGENHDCKRCHHSSPLHHGILISRAESHSLPAAPFRVAAPSDEARAGSSASPGCGVSTRRSSARATCRAPSLPHRDEVAGALSDEDRRRQVEKDGPPSTLSGRSFGPSAIAL